jgi:hypothetical protein
MRNESFFRQAASYLVGLLLLVSASAVLAQSPADPLEALRPPGSAASFTEGTPTILGVDQWDHDIVKLQVNQPGVLVLSDPGAGAQLVSFALAVPTTVTIAVLGPSGLIAGLYGEDGSLLAAEARGTQVLPAGRYFVRVEGALDAYEVTITGSLQ